ncbi:hypothetical protein DF185_19335 [Marinifilum breve]|uniref:DUF5074 domain-containing protein n=1 Tax=Marinifilum breve TaxID=2184082 RepID=A0A2V4A609_9BACT|nr:DUF5074 domain-containing protein [Marinifilum breve]PXX96800.1 hypothetical protein DF185_19335 [Marinifilum breve]
MRIKFVGAILVFLLAACSDDDQVAPIVKDDSVYENAVEVSDDNVRFELNLGESVSLSPKIQNLEEGSSKWFRNGELVAETLNYSYKAENAGVDTLDFVVENQGGIDSLTYLMQVFGNYTEGTFILCMSSEDNTGTVGFLKDKTFTPAVFQSTNEEKTLGENLLSGRYYNGKIWFVSQSGPTYVSIVDAQTMELESQIENSEASAPGYIAVSKNNAYIVNAHRRGRTLHALENNTIGTAFEGVEDVPGIKSSVHSLEDKVLFADGKTLKTVLYADNTIETLVTFTENVSGIVTDDEGNVWVGTEGRNESAKFRKLDANLDVVETIELDESVKLYRNGVLTSSGTKNFYWQEPSTGNIHCFNVESKKQEQFATPFNFGLYLTTALKEHPVTGDVYIAGVTDFFDTSKSKLIVLSAEGEELEQYENIGNSPLDFIFSYKDLYRSK